MIHSAHCGCLLSDQYPQFLATNGTSSLPQWIALTAYRFLFLGNHFNYASRAGSIAAKVAVQQALFTPIFNTYFFGMQAVLKGQPPSGVIAHIQETVPTSMKRSAMFWPVVTALSFAFISPQYRFMFSGVFAVVWQSYLSFLNRRVEKVTIEGVETP